MRIPPLCPVCHAEMEDVGADWLDQCDGPTLRARRYTCPRCPEPVVMLLRAFPNPSTEGAAA